MRHRKDHRRLGRKAEHRHALLRNLVTALFQYERIETTVAKAKETRRLAERMITFGKKGDMAARRHVARFIMKPEVAAKLFSTIAPWYTERNGGYTRIVRLGHRLGDTAETAYLELVKTDEQKAADREARNAAKDAKVMGQSGEKPAKKTKKAESEAAVVEDKPKRGKKKEAAAGAGGGAKRRGGPRKVGGG